MVPGKKPMKPKMKFPRGYYDKTRKKFRNYRIRKGKKVPMKNTFIERKGVGRIDTRGEKEGLRLAKFIKQRGFFAPVKKQKKQKQFKPNINNINKILGGF